LYLFLGPEFGLELVDVQVVDVYLPEVADSFVDCAIQLSVWSRGGWFRQRSVEGV
jgi:hypothetical protein